MCNTFGNKISFEKTKNLRTFAFGGLQMDVKQFFETLEALPSLSKAQAREKSKNKPHHSNSQKHFRKMPQKNPHTNTQMNTQTLISKKLKLEANDKDCIQSNFNTIKKIKNMEPEKTKRAKSKNIEDISTYPKKSSKSKTGMAERLEEPNEFFTLSKAAQKKVQFQEKQHKQLLDQAIQTNNIKLFNQVLSKCAKLKQFKLISEVWEHILSSRLKPTQGTWSSYLNGCIRCGEIGLAQKSFVEMARNIKPNEVIYTVMIKGNCEIGQLSSAMQLLNQMKNNGIHPNIRTFNTILRGCARHGDLASAELVYILIFSSFDHFTTHIDHIFLFHGLVFRIQEMTEMGIEQDINSWENLASCLCQNFQLESVENILKLMEIQYRIFVSAIVLFNDSQHSLLFNDS